MIASALPAPHPPFAMPISAAQKRFLRSSAHALKPVVMVAERGLAPTVLKEIEIALDVHELIKVRVTAEDRAARKALIADMVAQTGANVVQEIGHVVALYRRNADAPKLMLPT